MSKPTERAGAPLVIGIIILLVVAACSTVYLMMRTNEGEVRLSEAEMENLAMERVKEYWEELEDFGYQIQLVELNEPLVDELVVKHKIYKSYEIWISPSPVCIVAVGCYDGQIFILPDEFNNMIQREEISANETMH